MLTFTTGGAHVVAVRYDGVGQFAYSDDAIGVVEAPTAAAAGEWHFIVLSVGADGRDERITLAKWMTLSPRYTSHSKPSQF